MDRITDYYPKRKNFERRFKEKSKDIVISRGSSTGKNIGWDM